MRSLPVSTVLRRVGQLSQASNTGTRWSAAFWQTSRTTVRSQPTASTPSLSIRALHTKSYSPSMIIAALEDPSSLRGVDHVIIKEPEYYADSNEGIYKRPDPWDPARVLPTLEGMPDVKSISVDVNQIMFHSATTDRAVRYRLDDGRPEFVLGQLGLSCQCTEVCAWSLKQYPKVLIHHSTIRNLLLESIQYKHDPKLWKFVVSEQEKKPEYRAFDYTAEFYSRDICDPDCDCEITDSFVDLGLWGAGKYHCGSQSDLSMHFIRDFMANTEFFGRNPWAWRPNLYIDLRRRDGMVRSVPTLNDCRG